MLGILVQTNFGGVLTMGGAPLGIELDRYAFAPRTPIAAARDDLDGSCMIVVATDAPLSARDLERLAARAVFGLARTGSSFSHGSGDYAIAFSTARPASQPVPTLPPVSGDALSPLFQAALEATEEAVYNSLLRATTTATGSTTVDALPIDRTVAILRKYNAIK